MSTITFRGVYVRYYDCRQGKEGGDTYLRIYFDADLSKPVREEMGWGEPTEGLLSGKLTGSLVGRTLSIAPGDKALKNLEFSIDCQEVKDFAFSTVLNDSGTVQEHRLHFVVKTRALNSEGSVRGYMEAVGHHKSVLKLSFDRNEQANLPLSEDANAEAEPAAV